MRKQAQYTGVRKAEFIVGYIKQGSLENLSVIMYGLPTSSAGVSGRPWQDSNGFLRITQ